MVETLNSNTSDCMLSDLGIRPVGSLDNKGHNPDPTSHYGVLWRAGKNSIIRNCFVHIHRETYYRPSFVIDQLAKDSWIALKSIASPSTFSGVTYSSDCATKFANHTEIASRI